MAPAAARSGRWRAGCLRNDGHFVANQISRERRQPIVLTFCPTILDSDVTALNVAGLAQPSAESRTNVTRAVMSPLDRLTPLTSEKNGKGQPPA
jgi:hypothetical protein